MEKIIYENSFGNKIELTDKFPFFLSDYDGIHEKNSELYGISSAFGIGSLYVGRSVNKRNIIIYGYIKDKFVERRQQLYNVFPDNDEGTLFYYEDDFSAKIKCRVEKVDIEKTGPVRYFTISLIAFNPYFTDVEETNLSIATWEGGIEFPLEIPSDGLEFDKKNNNMTVEILNPTKIESGLNIHFIATGKVKKPSVKNIATQEILTLDFELKIGDEIIITTEINNKNIILKRDGLEKNINNYLLFGTKYLQLKPGQNYFKILAEEGIENLTAEVNYSLYYEAI
ncbi:putative phage tail protein [Mycoplasma sp. CAG:877]|nr:putative phage tail protein [Mycoplasma sp. CAG:877]